MQFNFNLEDKEKNSEYLPPPPPFFLWRKKEEPIIHKTITPQFFFSFHSVFTVSFRNSKGTLNQKHKNVYLQSQLTESENYVYPCRQTAAVPTKS